MCFACISERKSEKTRSELRKKYGPDDFFFDLAGSKPIQGEGGDVRLLFLNSLRSLAGEGVSHALFNLGPCGLNTFHSHPRATELLYVIDADFLQVGFFEENEGKDVLLIKKSDSLTLIEKDMFLGVSHRFWYRTAIVVTKTKATNPKPTQNI